MNHKEDNHDNYGMSQKDEVMEALAVLMCFLVLFLCALKVIFI